MEQEIKLLIAVPGKAPAFSPMAKARTRGKIMIALPAAVFVPMTTDLPRTSHFAYCRALSGRQAVWYIWG